MKLSKKIRKHLNRNLGEVTHLENAGFGVRLSLGIAQATRRPFDVLPVQGYAEASETVCEVAPATQCEVIGPARPNENAVSSKVPIGALYARKFEHAVASNYASTIKANDTIAVPNQYADEPNRSIADGVFLLWHGNDSKGVLHTNSSPIDRSSGILLFGSGTYNWYHWLIEQLPTAFLAARLPPDAFKSVPFVVPENVLDAPSFKESLELFVGDRPVETIGATPCKFESLFVFDSPIQEPINMLSGKWPKPSDYAFHVEVMRAYRLAILQKLGIQTRIPKRRIFLARGNNRRSYNQEESLGIAKELGFEECYLEKLSFKEQVQLMHDASIVVGPSGASFATSLFCQPGAHLLSWLLPEYRGFCSYTNLATIAGSHLRYIFTPAEQPIKSTSAAYSATYHLDPDDFKAALQDMLAAEISRSA